jgi:hypothetical protein
MVQVAIVHEMKAEPLFHQRIDYEDGTILEMVISRVPSPVKGDHRHLQGIETAYTFSTVEKLMADLWADVRALRGGE